MFRSFWGGFFLFLSTMVGFAFVMRPDTVDNVLTYFGWLGLGIGFAILGLVYLVPVCGVVAFGVWLHYYIKAQRVNLMRQQNGSYPLQKLDPRKRYVFYDPNQQVAPVVTVDPDAGVIEHNGGVPWEYQYGTAQKRALVANTQAAMPSDDAIVRAAKHISNGVGGGGLMRALRPGAAEQKALGQAPKGWDDVPPARRAEMPPRVEPAAQVPVQAPYVPTLSDAVRSAEPFVWPIGYSTETQKLAAFRFDKHYHCGIVGSPGTGKTTGVGFLLVSHALRQGVHTIIVDGDGGASWNALAPWTEHILADDTNLPVILDRLEGEMERRARVLAQHNALTWQDTNDALRPMLCVLEEFGDLRSRIGAASKAAGIEVDDKVDRLLRRARKVGIAMAVIDQYPDQWTPQMIAAAKCMVVFQLGPNQGNKVGEYNAQNLPDSGVFLLRGVRYNTWPMHGKAHKLLADVPALSVSARVIDRDGRGVHAHANTGAREGGYTGTPPVNPPVNPYSSNSVNTSYDDVDDGEWRDVGDGNYGSNQVPASTPVSVAGWYEWTITNYFPIHVELLQTDENGYGVGVMDLARAMAYERDGHIRNYDDMKGIASKVAKRIRKEAGVQGASGVVPATTRVTPKRENRRTYDEDGL